MKLFKRHGIKSAQDLAVKQQANEAERKRLDELEEQIIQESTAHKMDELRKARFALQNAERETRDAAKELLASKPMPKRLSEIRDETKLLLAQIQALTTTVGGSLPEKLIRFDAVSQVDEQLTEARETIDRVEKMRGKLRPNQSLGSRALHDEQSAIATLEAGTRRKGLAQIGEQVFAMRERIRELRDESERISREHKQAVLCG